ncbi:phage replisome organizer N-terminal domain-containing protein [Megasphaera sp.]|uniref:phage replisome organizer N-terminal domain-containing protein n=2 Tax=Megasphaera TaxID=906 RepID=UPI001D8EFBA4|nr:phage replisome organizer N-terminal domain-containing protein [Megasphaera sp.]MBS6789308.1 phage replisome organizer N-terminal domain-containing protein [Megasphaera sp.]
MKKLQWLKTKVGLFLDPRILYLMNLPNGDSYIVLWFFLKDMAGMVNDDGKIYVSETEALTTQLIAKSLHRRQPFIENGLRALEQVDLIERDEKGLIRILIWDELQSFHRDERRREQTHERVRRYRERQRLAQEEEAQQESFQEESLIAEPSGEDQTDTPDEEPVVLSIDEFVEEAVVAEKAGDMPLEELPVSDEGEEPQTELKTLTGEAVTTPKAVKGYASVQTYQNLFGPMQGDFAHRLITLENMWGSEATCTAIEMAHENEVNNINYIAAILKNSNGRPMRGKRKEDKYNGYPNFEAYIDGVLRGEPEYKPHLQRDGERKSGLRHISDTGEGLL